MMTRATLEKAILNREQPTGLEEQYDDKRSKSKVLADAILYMGEVEEAIGSLIREVTGEGAEPCTELDKRRDASLVEVLNNGPDELNGINERCMEKLGHLRALLIG